MNLPADKPIRPASHQHAFSLLEILLVASMMTIIVFGLYTMFEHTQRALRGNSTQVDVQEAGRAVMDILAREIQQSAAAGLPGGTNLFALLSYPNSAAWNPIRQALDTNGYPPFRTNLMMDLFFLTRTSNYWSSLGFFIASPTNPMVGVGNDGVGSLYRFSPSTPATLYPGPSNVNSWISQFSDYARPYYRTNSGVLADGIVHLRFQAFHLDGLPYVWYGLRTGDAWPSSADWAYPAVYLDWQGRPIAAPPMPPGLQPLGPTNVILRADGRKLNETEFFFRSNAVPAFIEVELGILEPHTWERFKALPSNPTVRQDYLLKHAAQVHLFRKRISIRLAQ